MGELLLSLAEWWSGSVSTRHTSTHTQGVKTCKHSYRAMDWMRACTGDEEILISKDLTERPLHSCKWEWCFHNTSRVMFNSAGAGQGQSSLLYVGYCKHSVWNFPLIVYQKKDGSVRQLDLTKTHKAENTAIFILTLSHSFSLSSLSHADICFISRSITGLRMLSIIWKLD